MNARAVAIAVALLSSPARAQGYGGLGADAPGFAVPQPGTALVFPKDHDAHPNFRTEWWYLTANLKGSDGENYGVQWTLFRHALEPNSARDGWDDRNIWMGHAAATSATVHVFAQKLARGGIKQAGVEAAPFRAFIDDWTFESRDAAPEAGIKRLRLHARDKNFSFTLDLAADAPIALQGEAGFSRKSDAGQASHYYSQPFFKADGVFSLNGREMKVAGRAWMDHEWSSQPLAPDQKGWDWFSLHLAGGEKLMLFRLRGATSAPFLSGNWIAPDGGASLLQRDDIVLEPLPTTAVAGRNLPTRWRIKIKSRGLDIETAPLNSQSWMGTDFPYWEGPIRFKGSHEGEGYLEMTGY